MGQCFSGPTRCVATSRRDEVLAPRQQDTGVTDRVLYPVASSGGLQVAVSQARCAAGAGGDATPLLVRQTTCHTFIALFEGLGEDRRAVAAFCRTRAFEVRKYGRTAAALLASPASRPQPLRHHSPPVAAPLPPPAALPREQRAPPREPPGGPEGDCRAPGCRNLCHRPPEPCGAQCITVPAWRLAAAVGVRLPVRPRAALATLLPTISTPFLCWPSHIYSQTSNVPCHLSTAGQGQQRRLLRAPAGGAVHPALLLRQRGCCRLPAQPHLRILQCQAPRGILPHQRAHHPVRPVGGGWQPGCGMLAMHAPTADAAMARPVPF